MIDKIKERIKSLYSEKQLQDYSSFFLIDYYIDNNNELIINELLPLENGEYDINIEKNIIISDKNGKVLINSSKENSTISQKILYVINNKIIIQKNEIKNKTESMDIFESRNNKLANENFLITYTLTGPNKDILLVNKENKSKKEAYLFSINKKSIISPIFNDLEEINNDLFKFTDTIRSKSMFKGKTISSELIGFITSNGTIKDYIYDSRINDIRHIDLSTHQYNMQYKSLKNQISGDLDSDIDLMIEKEHRKQNAIRRLKYKIKTK